MASKTDDWNSMDLREFAGILPVEGVRPGSIEINGISSDSREAGEGTLFVAVPGTKTDGAAYAADAQRRGAAAVVAGRGAVGTALDIPILEVDEPRLALALGIQLEEGADGVASVEGLDLLQPGAELL